MRSIPKPRLIYCGCRLWDRQSEQSDFCPQCRRKLKIGQGALCAGCLDHPGYNGITQKHQRAALSGLDRKWAEFRQCLCQDDPIADYCKNRGLDPDHEHAEAAKLLKAKPKLSRARAIVSRSDLEGEQLNAEIRKRRLVLAYFADRLSLAIEPMILEARNLDDPLVYAETRKEAKFQSRLMVRDGKRVAV